MISGKDGNSTTFGGGPLAKQAVSGVKAVTGASSGAASPWWAEGREAARGPAAARPKREPPSVIHL